MKAISKSGVRMLVEAGDQQALLAAFDEDPNRTRRFVTRLAYSRDEDCRTRAIECFESLSRERSDRMPEFFFEIIRRSLWEMNEESGGVAWSAPEIVGAVIAGSPDRFGGFFSYMVCAAVDEPTFHPSLFEAFTRVRAAKPSLAEAFEADIRALRDANGGQHLP